MSPAAGGATPVTDGEADTTPNPPLTFEGAETSPSSSGGGAETPPKPTSSSPGTRGGSETLLSSQGHNPAFPRIEKYELLEEIGHGGMATVYRARDTRLGREVAVKLIHRHLRENAEVRTRFVAEARAAAKLRHPGIVDVFDVSDEGDPERYLVVELVRGTTLRKVLQQHRDMPAEVGAAIVLQLCEAVDHAHASSIVHRDIKPENVLVELPQDRLASETPRPSDAGSERAASDGSPASKTPVPSSPAASRAPSSDGRAGVVIKITDFGIAKLLDAQGVTSTGQVLGSPAHMAPEQIEGGDVDPRTDVFALGVLMYECLVGHLPFEGKNPAQVLRRVLDGEYPPADRERPGVGGRWARIVAAALAHAPADRTPSASALAEEIRVELAALGISDPRAEISAYFADPPGYTAASPARIVPRLTERAEAARKARDVWGAAADYNRVLALAPDDLAILKRIASLGSNAQRWILVRRAAAIVAGSAVLGVGAFGVARAMKAKDVVAPPRIGGTTEPRPPATPLTARPAPSTTAVVERQRPDVDPPPHAPIEPPIPIPRIPATPVIDPRPTPAPISVATTRDVQINIHPKGARLFVDSKEERWLGVTFSLPVGQHTFVAMPRQPGCCNQSSKTVNLTPAAPGEPPVKLIQLDMEILPATVSLAANAPPGARAQCPGVGVNLSPGTTVSARLRETEQLETCIFSAPNRGAGTPVTFKLKAGESKVLSWPE